jgi:Ca2+-transporting ATPase
VERRWWVVALNQFRDFMIVVLLVAAVVSGVLGEPKDTVAILAIVLLNGIVGAVHEFRAQQAMASLRRIAPLAANVVRGGRSQRIDADELVPGDIVVLAAGDIVPADIRLIECAQLHTDESVLTGESMIVAKSPEAIAAPDIVVGDRLNMAFKSTSVAEGRGLGVVVATGIATEIGKIAQLLREGEQTRTPLQLRLGRFGSRLALGVLAVCAVVFALGVMRGGDALLMFLTAVSLAVAAIPEALPAVVTVALAIGAKKLSVAKSLVRHLPAVEALGSVTFICTDKTGTLTQNRMVVAELALAGGGRGALAEIEDPAVRAAFGSALALCNDVPFGDGAESTPADATERALADAAASGGYDKVALSAAHPRVAEIAFNTATKRMTTVHATGASAVAYMKGAPENVVECCTRRLGAAGAPEAFDASEALQEATALAARGFRVLGLAQRPLSDFAGDTDALEQDFTLIGFVALSDPLRPEVPAAVTQCMEAGVKPVMITGDHPQTAAEIGRRLGLLDGDTTVLTGAELARLSDAEFAAKVESIRVYARVDPEQKLRIVRALQQRGEFVAMTGDGVNDAPALKQASIGIAMGQRGTDVAREASDIVLLDDNFSTIVAAIREGRRVYDNIRKFIKYTMSSNAGEILVLLILPFAGYPVPLLPIHILWVNLVTDGVPGVAFSAEPAESGIMRRPPRSPTESVFGAGMLTHMIWAGLVIGGVSSAAVLFVAADRAIVLQTMVFTTLVFAQLVHAIAVRTERDSLRTIGYWSNPYLLLSIFIALAGQLAVVYVPSLNELFSTSPLQAGELALCVALSVAEASGTSPENAFARRR